MRNLKRALSLTLASVMLLGMMVVGGSAVGYPDVDESQNVEAIEVLQAVGIMGGDNNGNFSPDDYVTREQMAVIMSQLLKLDYNYYKGTNPFSDVPEWAAPYVAACAANGITAGIGDGLYGSKQNIQAVQAALMMLKALGYFQYAGDYEGGYVLATVKQATEVGLFKGIDSESNADLTRNQIAQMVLNSLKADMVRFTGDPGITYTGSNGESWVGGYRPEYTPRTSTDPKYNQLIDNKHSTDIDTTGQYYVQLGEELYNGDLVQRYDSDIFERPGYTWTYKTELIGTYVDHDKFLARYTAGVSGRTLYDLLNNITIANYRLETYVDGHVAGSPQTVASQYKYDREDEIIDKDTELVRSNTKDVGITANGVETEVYLDRDNGIITIVSMHTWLAKANNTYNETRESASLKVYETSATGKTKVVEPDDAPEVTGVTQDSYYLVKMSDKDSANLEVVKIMEPTILTDSTITKFSQDGGVDSEGKVTKLTTDGTQYNRNTVAFYDDDILDEYNDNLLSNATYNVYLDQNGYFVGVDLYEGEKNYVFITGYDMRNSNLSVQTATANGIFLDGTMENITVNVKDTNKNIESVYDTDGNPRSAYYMKWQSWNSDGVYLLNRWYTYTKTDSGVYTLKPCYNASNNEILMFASTAPADGELKLRCDRVTLDGVSSVLQGEYMQYTSTGTNTSRAYGEDDSVFIAVDTDDVSASIQKNGISLDVTKAITDVRGTYTGVQNVELIATASDRVEGQYLNGTTVTPAKESEPIGENVYTVYDKNHFIIGSVILGNTKGGVENYAYILNPVKSEEKKVDGYYYWEFECVYQGEIKTFQAKTKYESTIKELKDNRYRIVELRFDGEYVVDCETIKADEIWGSDFDEIKRQVLETENVYDVVLKDSNFARVTRDWNSANTQNGTLYYDGHTLYVLGKPGSTPTTSNDRGLAFSKNAKVVVRQQDKDGDMENYEFSNMEEAYTWINDADGNRDNGLQYKGIISAVLNTQGVAEWVVFYNDNPWSATSGSTSGSGDTSRGVTISDAEFNDRNGNASFKVEVERPAHVPASASVSVDWTVKVNGKRAAAGTTTIAGGTTYKWEDGSKLYNIANPGDNLAVEIDSVSFDQVKVLYVVNATDTTNTVKVQSGATSVLKVGTAGTDASISYSLSADYDLGGSPVVAAANITTGNITLEGDAAVSNIAQTTGAGTIQKNTTGDVYATADTDYARVIIPAASLSNRAWNFTSAVTSTALSSGAWATGSTAGADLDTVTLTVAPSTASAADGTPIEYTVTVSATAFPVAGAVRVEIPKLGFDYTFTNKTAAGAADAVAAAKTSVDVPLTASQDIAIAASDVKVTALSKAPTYTAADISWTNYEVRINLSAPAVALTDGSDDYCGTQTLTGGAKFKNATLTPDGKTIVLSFIDSALAVNDEITIDAAKLFAAYGVACSDSNTKITLQADGKASLSTP